MIICAMTGYGWSWRLCQQSDSGRLDDLQKAGAMLLPSFRQALVRHWPPWHWLWFLSGIHFWRKRRCGLESWLDFPEPVGAFSCGAGSMLLLAITTRRLSPNPLVDGHH